MTVTLDWLGCATYRLSVNGLVIFLDTFMDRISSAPKVGLTSDAVTEADFALIGHSHFDHIAGADVIAKRTGAKVIGSNETTRVLREAGVAADQLLPSQGGERHRLNEEVTVRVFPSIHSCIWSKAAPPGVAMTGDYGVTQDERAARIAKLFDSLGGGLPADLQRESNELRARQIGSRSDGGALDYLIETPEGTIFFQDSMGVWTGVLRDVRADVAILAAAGRANIDGEPIQGAVEDIIAREAEILRPRTVILSHHDNWMGVPDVPDVVDTSPVREELGRLMPRTKVLDVGYMEGTRLF
jgi:L-ascorbate metabolism protein UlaG (beta-lactamase superfamily)